MCIVVVLGNQLVTLFDCFTRKHLNLLKLTAKFHILLTSESAKKNISTPWLNCIVIFLYISINQSINPLKVFWKVVVTIKQSKQQMTIKHNFDNIQLTS